MNLFSWPLLLVVLYTAVSVGMADKVESFRISNQNEYGYGRVEAGIRISNDLKWYPVCFNGYQSSVLQNIINYKICNRTNSSKSHIETAPVKLSDISKGALLRFSETIRYTLQQCNDFQEIFCGSNDPNEYPVRLTGDNSNSTGRLEISINGVWGTVCKDHFDVIEATMVCRQLGFTDFPGSVYDGGQTSSSMATLPIVLDDLQCGGREKHLVACSHRKIGTHNCTHADDAFVNCAAQPELMLVGGLDERRGRVEIKVGTGTGSICWRGFNETVANVICQQLGFTEEPGKQLLVVLSSKSPKIWLNDVQCSGTEAHIWDCEHKPWLRNNCDHNQYLSVECPMVDDYSLRLQDGSISGTEASGRLEIKLGGTFKPMCGLINKLGAELACQQMGYPSNNVRIYPRGYFTSGNSPHVLSDAYCYTGKKQLKDCSFDMPPSEPVASKICGGSMGIICTDQPDYQIQLVGGNRTDGRLEVKIGGVWGTVCHDGFDILAAKVVCRQLGYPTEYASVTKDWYPPASSDAIIWLDNVECDGSEDSLQSCKHLFEGRTNCYHTEDIAMTCSQPRALSARLMDGENAYSGRLEVSHLGVWGTVCADYFLIEIAQVACRQMGLPFSGARRTTSQYGNATGRIWLDDLYCTGKESNLQFCYHKPIGTHDCLHVDDLSIVCAEKETGEIKSMAGAMIGSITVVFLTAVLACLMQG